MKVITESFRNVKAVFGFGALGKKKKKIQWLDLAYGLDQCCQIGL